MSDQDSKEHEDEKSSDNTQKNSSPVDKFDDDFTAAIIGGLAALALGCAALYGISISLKKLFSKDKEEDKDIEDTVSYRRSTINTDTSSYKRSYEYSSST